MVCSGELESMDELGVLVLVELGEPVEELWGPVDVSGEGEAVLCSGELESIEELGVLVDDQEEGTE